MIIERVNEVISIAESDATMDDGFSFNQHETVKRINFYINNRFLERDDEAIFWNLSNSRITHFAKNIDLDTKDLQPYGVGEVSFVKIWILKMKFYKWLEENEFSVKLNDLAETCAAYGSALFKICDDGEGKELEECNLRNVYFDPTCDSIRDTDVVEKHYLSAMQLRNKKDVWENIDTVLDTEPDDDSKKYEIWEFWGEYENETKDVEFGHFIGYGYDKDATILLEETDVKKEDAPYRDFHIGRYFGRWLRIGVVERLFKLQERANQLVNQNAQASEIASLLLLRTANGDNLGNVLTDIENGQVIQSDDLQQIGFTNTGMSQFVNELAAIERQADTICLTPQIVQGENMPAGTPFRSMAIVANSAKSSFRFIKERIGESLGYILKEEIFPDVVKGWNHGDILEIAGDENDVKIYDGFLRKQMKWKQYVDTVLSGNIMTQEALDAIDEQITGEVETTGRRVEIPENFFDFDYLIRTNITGEQVDKAQKNDAYFNALQMVQQNPAIINTPLFKQYLEDNDISWWRLSPEEQAALQPQQPQGASGAAPMMQPKTDKLSAQVNA